MICGDQVWYVFLGGVLQRHVLGFDVEEGWVEVVGRPVERRYGSVHSVERRYGSVTYLWRGSWRVPESEPAA